VLKEALSDKNEIRQRLRNIYLDIC